MKPTTRLTALTIAATVFTVLLTPAGAAHADASAAPAADAASVGALYCVGIPYIHYGTTVIYPGGEVCVPGP